MAGLEGSRPQEQLSIQQHDARLHNARLQDSTLAACVQRMLNKTAGNSADDSADKACATAELCPGQMQRSFVSSHHAIAHAHHPWHLHDTSSSRNFLVTFLYLHIEATQSEEASVQANCSPVTQFLQLLSKVQDQRASSTDHVLSSMPINKIKQ